MKKYVLRVITLCLTLAMLMGLSMVPMVSAAESVATVTVKADKTQYVQGGDAVITFVIADSPALQSIGLKISFDTKVFELVDGEWNLDNALLAHFDTTKCLAMAVFEDDTIIADGTVFTLNLKVKEGIDDCTSEVSVTPVLKNVDESISTNAVPATITVKHACVAGEQWQSDGANHWKLCVTCSNLVGELEPHSYTNGCDTTCEVCGFVRDDTEHSWSSDYKYDDNKHWNYCINCGEDVTNNVAEHSYGDWIIDNDATVDAAGSKHKECVCGHTITGTIPKVLKFASATLSLDSNIAINFKVAPDYFTTEGYSDPYVVFSMEGRGETIVTDYTIDTSNGRYVFQYSNISPQLMGNTVNAVVYATYKGELYESNAQEYSVKTYCYNRLQKSTDTKFRTLVVDLLNYGAETQLNVGYKTDALVNAELTDEQKAEGTTTTRTFTDSLNTKYATVENPKAVWKSASLVLTDAVVVKLKIQADDVTNLSVKIEAAGKEWIIPSSQFDYSGGYYYVNFSGLYANQMSKLIHATICEGDTAVSDTLQYSIETYVARKQTSADGAMVVAMMKYGDSAARLYN